jgi:hypothetical protein
MYVDGTDEFEKELSMFVSTHDRSKNMEKRYLKMCQRRLGEDWVRALLYGFGPYRMSSDFDYFLSFLRESYVSERFDFLDLDICSESSKLYLVRYTMELLTNLCKQSDEDNALESEYLPIKFFMFACLAREEQLKTEIMKKTHHGQITSQHSVWLVDFFNFIKRDFEYLTQSSFSEFTIKKMMDDFMTRAVYKYEGLLLQDDLNSSFAPPPSSQSSFANIALSTSVSFSTPHPSAMSASSFGKRPNPQHEKGLPLPEMYDPKYGSSQTAAAAERAASISYYALISVLINFYMNHCYDTQLPQGLYYHTTRPSGTTF